MPTIKYTRRSRRGACKYFCIFPTTSFRILFSPASSGDVAADVRGIPFHYLRNATGGCEQKQDEDLDMDGFSLFLTVFYLIFSPAGVQETELSGLSSESVLINLSIYNFHSLAVNLSALCSCQSFENILEHIAVFKAREVLLTHFLFLLYSTNWLTSVRRWRRRRRKSEYSSPSSTCHKYTEEAAFHFLPLPPPPPTCSLQLNRNGNRKP